LNLVGLAAVLSGVAICGLSFATLARRHPVPVADPAERAGRCLLVGTWNAPNGATVEVAPGGTWRLHKGPSTVVGTWKETGDRLALTDTSTDGSGPICPRDQIGTYGVQLGGAPCSLNLRLVDDPCAPRGRVLKRLRLSKSTSSESVPSAATRAGSNGAP
jgi:hypothetical protein